MNLTYQLPSQRNPAKPCISIRAELLIFCKIPIFRWSHFADVNHHIGKFPNGGLVYVLKIKSVT